MKHARDDYDHLQDPSGKIPQDEPVFLIRGQDVASADTVRFWAILNDKFGGDPELSQRARIQAAKMDNWPKKKPADL